MKQSQAAIKLLLIESDADEAKIFQEYLKSSQSSFNVSWGKTYKEALNNYQNIQFNIVVLDLAFTRKNQINLRNIQKISDYHVNSLLIVMLAVEDKKLINRVLSSGADDILIKTQLNDYWLSHILNYMIDSHKFRRLLTLSEKKFRAISDESPLGIFVSDSSGKCEYTNQAYQKISGLNFDTSIGANWSSVVHPDDRKRVLLEWQKAESEQISFKTEFRFLRDDQSVVWTRVNSAYLKTGNNASGYIQTLEDISERKIHEIKLKLAQQSLFEAKEQAQVTLNSIGDAVIASDIHGHVTYLNKTAEMMTGWTFEEAIGKPIVQIFHIINSVTREMVPNPSNQAIKEDIAVSLSSNSVLIRRDGLESPIEDSAAPIHNRNGDVSGAVMVFHDVTKSVALALKMAHLAHHDSLTKLPNRLLLEDRIKQAITQANRHKKLAALLFLDLDYFKYINDSLGHTIGDKLLQSVASRLMSCVRETDTVSRLGGDEFVILLAEIEGNHDASHIAEKLLSDLSKPHCIENSDLHITPSIGISIFPEDGSDVETLLKNADTAMYHAKERGRNRYQFFKLQMNTSAVRRMQVEVRLRRATKKNEFILHYQPKFNLSTGELSGIEALIRWQDPKLGLIYPKDFISIAEECGLIIPIGRWVINAVCHQISSWLRSGQHVVPVAINISALEFRHKGFLCAIMEAIKKWNIPANLLEIELTESVLMHEVDASSILLKSLNNLGIRLAIDDFGTGYSSLSYLKLFPIDTLKIDQSFVHDITTDQDDATIVSAVIGMGKKLHQVVVAEGVETIGQLEFLKNELCDVGQGFWFSKPLSAKDFEKFLNSEKPAH